MKAKTLKRYFIITFLWSWILWLPFVLPSFGVYDMTETLEGLLMPVVMLAAFGPLFSAMILTYQANGKTGLKQFFQKCLDVKIKPIYYVMAVVLGLVITAVAHYFTNIVGIDTLPNSLVPEELDIPLYILIIPYTLLLLFFGGGQEEFGWRGFAQEPMQDIFGVVKGSIIIGLLWSLWHGPLWLIPGEGHSYYSFFAFSLYATSWSLIIGLMYNLSGKKMVIAWIMHTIGNLSVPLFPVLFLEDVPQPGYWVWAILNAMVAIGFALWVYYRKREQLNARF
jgi:membrane protease YdiL (CAAX protease family)